VFDSTINRAIALGLNYREILGCYPFFEFGFGENILQVQTGIV